MVDVVGREASNYQYCVFEVDESVVALSRDELCRLLAAEGVLARRYFYPGVHRVPPYSASNAPVDRLPNTEHLCQVLFQLPIGAGVSLETVQQIADSMDCILRWQREIARRMAHAA
jgi:dTDP-4-amino-4,6-dideoxygalactose transaminase